MGRACSVFCSEQIVVLGCSHRYWALLLVGIEVRGGGGLERGVDGTEKGEGLVQNGHWSVSQTTSKCYPRRLHDECLLPRQWGATMTLPGIAPA